MLGSRLIEITQLKPRIGVHDRRRPHHRPRSGYSGHRWQRHIRMIPNSANYNGKTRRASKIH